MKCPKCGFNSFEYYDSCKKCSSDMTGYKQTYSITSMVLPQEVKDTLAAGFRSAVSAADQVSESEEAHGDIFSFDLPEKSPSAPVKGNDDPFNFMQILRQARANSILKASHGMTPHPLRRQARTRTTMMILTPFSVIQKKILKNKSS